MGFAYSSGLIPDNQSSASVIVNNSRDRQGVAIPVTTPVDVRSAAIARGREIKRVNALTAILCGCVPALLLSVLFRTELRRWIVGFAVGLLWANFFEYAYHRFLLHLPGTFFAQRHLGHHMTVGTPTEAEHVNLGSSPIWVFMLFVLNGVPAVIGDVLFKSRIVPGTLVAFTAYFIITEEFHWRFHLGGWLPPGFRSAKINHMAHHERPNAQFNIFLPLWDRLLGTSGEVDFPIEDAPNR